MMTKRRETVVRKQFNFPFLHYNSNLFPIFQSFPVFQLISIEVNRKSVEREMILSCKIGKFSFFSRFSFPFFISHLSTDFPFLSFPIYQLISRSLSFPIFQLISRFYHFPFFIISHLSLISRFLSNSIFQFLSVFDHFPFFNSILVFYHFPLYNTTHFFPFFWEMSRKMGNQLINRK